MKLGLIAMAAIAACCSIGCAANPALQSQVADLQKESNRQNEEVRELSAKAAKCAATKAAYDLQKDASDLATAAWSWLSSEADDTAKHGDQIIACYRAGSSEVHTFEQSQNLMARCYKVSQQK